MVDPSFIASSPVRERKSKSTHIITVSGTRDASNETTLETRLKERIWYYTAQSRCELVVTKERKTEARKGSVEGDWRWKVRYVEQDRVLEQTQRSAAES